MNIDVDIKECVRIANLRCEGKAKLRSHLPLSSDYELVGVMGEMAFSFYSGLPIDETQRMNGDGGSDFTFRLREGSFNKIISIDVKTAQRAKYLVVREGHIRSHIYVLAEARPLESCRVNLKGWAGYKDVLKANKDDGTIFGFGISNYYIHSADLRTMDGLLRLIFGS